MIAPSARVYHKIPDQWEPIIYSKKIDEVVHDNVVFNSVFNRDYEGELKGPGSKLVIRSWPELKANDYALAREIVAWKENVAAKWDDVHVESVQMSDNFNMAVDTNDVLEATVKLNTAGLGRSLGVELVTYREIDGETKFHDARPLKVVEEDGDVLTFYFKDKIKDSGIYRYSFRVYPWNNNLPHRQDFAYLKWF